MTWFQKPPLGTPLNWSNPLNKGCAMHLAMNEGHGDKVQDLSMNGNHGALNNFAFPPTAASGWNPGQNGVRLNFDGVNDYVDCGNNSILDITGDHTLAGIICPSTIVGARNIIRKGYGNASYVMYHEDSVIKYNYHNGTTWVGTVSGGALVVNELVGVVITRRYSGATANVKIYLDGIEVISVNRNGVAVSNNSSMYVGQDVDNNNFFGGSIDQPRIQSRAWSAKEVRDYAINPWQVYLDDDD